MNATHDTRNGKSRNVQYVNFEAMNTAFKKTCCLAAAILTIGCAAANTHRHCTHHAHRHDHYRHLSAPLHTARIRPVVTARIVHRLDQKERLRIVLAYLDDNRYITARKYACITGLDKAVAEAELNAFAADGRNPVTAVAAGKKRLYTRATGAAER